MEKSLRLGVILTSTRGRKPSRRRKGYKKKNTAAEGGGERNYGGGMKGHALEVGACEANFPS